MDAKNYLKTTRHVWLYALLKLVLEFDRSKLIFWIATRNALGVACALILGFAFFGAGPAAFACMGALIVAFADGDDAYRNRFRRIATSGLLCGFSVFIAQLAGVPHWLRFLLVPLWGFAGAFALILGPEAADLGLFSTVMLVVYLGSAVPLNEALNNSLFCLLGSVIQAALALTQWSRDRYRPEKRQLGKLFTSLSRLTDEDIFSQKSPPLSLLFSRTQLTMRSLSLRMDGESLRLRSLLNQAERLRLRLVILLRLKKRLIRAHGSPELIACFSDYYRTSARLLVLVSETLADSSAPNRFQNSGRAWDFSWEEMADPGLRLRLYLQANPQETIFEPMLREAYLQMESIAGILRAVAELSSQNRFLRIKDESSLSRSSRTSVIRSNFGILRANFSLRSGAFRHGVRMATCLLVGELILSFHPLVRGYWLPMTVALVLKPDFGTTFSRGILRMGGSLVGLAIATCLFHIFHPSWVVDVVLLSLFTFLLRWIGAANYGLYSIGISAFVVLLTAIMGSDPASVIGPRAVNTLIGGSLGLLAYLVWPAWEKVNGRARLENLLEGYRDYCSFAFQLDLNLDQVNQLDQARQNSRLARANFQSFILRLASEPGSQNTSLRFFDAILASSNRLAHSAMAIEADSKAFHSTESQRAYFEYVGVFLFNLDVAILTLKDQNVGSANALPKDLRVSFLRWIQASNIDSTNLTHLAIELDRMTNCVNTLVEQVLRFPAKELESRQSSSIDGARV